jgi:hypothetical protein
MEKYFKNVTYESNRYFLAIVKGHKLTLYTDNLTQSNVILNDNFKGKEISQTLFNRAINYELKKR